jgi:hypothetical protein
MSYCIVSIMLLQSLTHSFSITLLIKYIPKTDLYHLQVGRSYTLHIQMITPLLQCIWKQQLKLSMGESWNDHNDKFYVYKSDTNILQLFIYNKLTL